MTRYPESRLAQENPEHWTVGDQTFIWTRAGTILWPANIRENGTKMDLAGTSSVYPGTWYVHFPTLIDTLRSIVATTVENENFDRDQIDAINKAVGHLDYMLEELDRTRAAALKQMEEEEKGETSGT